MRTLWRNTTYLFWQYPVLWLPLIVADIVVFHLHWGERVLQRELTNWVILHLTQTHSVLSSAPEYLEPTPSLIAKVAFFSLPLTWGEHLISIFLYTSAFLITAEILRSIAESGAANLSGTVSSIRSSNPRMWGFSVKLLALYAGATYLGLTLLAFTFQFQKRLETAMAFPLSLQIYLEQRNLVGYVYVLPLMAGIAYIIAPLAIKLLQPAGSILAPNAAKKARIATIITVVAVASLGIFVPQIETSFFHQLRTASQVVVDLIETIGSVLIALPYITLFIALYLIANPESPLTLPPTAQLDADIPSEGDLSRS